MVVTHPRFGTAKEFYQGIGMSLGLKDLLSLDVTQLAYGTIGGAAYLACFLSDGTCFGAQRASKKAVEVWISIGFRFYSFRHIHIIVADKPASDRFTQR